MASLRVKATYSLDVETVNNLERLARKWSVSKSEALRRVIAMAVEQCAGSEGGTTAALDELQRSIGSARDLAERWLETNRAERKASARKREDRIGR